SLSLYYPFFSCSIPPPPPPTLLPYTTLFRSSINTEGSGLTYIGVVLSRAATRWDATVHQFPVPAFFDYPATREAMWRERSVQRRSEEHTSELQSRFDLVCRLLLEKKIKLDSV